MRRVNSEIYPLIHYLLVAKRSIDENPPAILWERSKSMTKNKNSSREQITLIPINEEMSSSIIDKFFEAYEIYDTTQFWKSKPIKVHSSNEETLTLILDRLPESERIYVRPNTYTIKRQIEAIRALLNHPHPGHRPLLRLLEATDKVEWPKVNKALINKWERLKNDSRPGTGEQRDFVKIALGTQDFAILEGPPGSGKTTAICEVILQAVKKGLRILLCASTHVAVDNVLERLKDDPNVIPIRISPLGREKRVSIDVRPFTLENIIENERKRLINWLRKQDRTQSQDYLLRTLESDQDNDSERTITHLILNSANLVCGTTIGILQHPDIKSSKSHEPVFDLMILDEASKTTFQEFLVPALYARKWIISGDPRQLSPFVEPEEIEGNIKGLLKNDIDRNACVDVFKARIGDKYNRNWFTNSLVGLDDDNEKKIYQTQADGLNVPIFDISSDDEINDKNKLTMFGSRIIIGSPSVFEKVEDLLPNDLITTRGQIPKLHLFERRVQHWLEKCEKEDYLEDEIPCWEKELAWRMIRKFELRKTPNNKKIHRFDEDIKNLLPSFLENEDHGVLYNNLEIIRRIALPSIIELLQEGFERQLNKNYGCTLTDGMSTDVLEPRHILLEYQQRMHPDISSFPRKFIYLSDEGEPVGLYDPPGIENERGGVFNGFASNYGGKRRVWIDVYTENPCKSRNYREARSIKKEYLKFLKWAKKNPRKDGRPWDVAILTFYLNQERVLSKQFQGLFNSPNFRHFKDNEGATKVQVCTVDRFQGHEADVVFLSFCRNKGIGFLDSLNRLNVALTRAKYQLIIFGSRKNFGGKYMPEILQQLVKNTPTPIRYRRDEDDKNHMYKKDRNRMF